MNCSTRYLNRSSGSTSTESSSEVIFGGIAMGRVCIKEVPVAEYFSTFNFLCMVLMWPSVPGDLSLVMRSKCCGNVNIASDISARNKL